MTNIKTFDAFVNESDVENALFKMATGGVDPKRLQKASKAVGAKKVKSVADFLGADPDKIMYDPKGFIDKFYYVDGFVIMPLYHELSVEVLQAMQVDKRLEQMRKAVDDAVSKGEYTRMFFYYDTKMLIAALIMNADRIPADKLYDCFVFVYTMSEYGFEMIDGKLMDKIYESSKHSRERAKRMARLAKKAKDGKVTLYRGVASESREDSMSWTLSKKVAKFFADRFESHGRIIEKTVPVGDVMDYLYDRNEEEVLLYKK